MQGLTEFWWSFWWSFFFALQLLFSKKYDFYATRNMKSWIRPCSWIIPPSPHTPSPFLNYPFVYFESFPKQIISCRRVPIAASQSLDLVWISIFEKRSNFLINFLRTFTSHAAIWKFPKFQSRAYIHVYNFLYTYRHICLLFIVVNMHTSV